MDHLSRYPRTSDEELIESETPDVENQQSEADRLARIGQELQIGFDTLHPLTPAVSIFGSARTSEDDPDYALAVATASKLGQEGFSIITGGGPGLMEAGNRGAQMAGATSIGLVIELPYEQAPNPYLDINLPFHYFFTRKVMFVRYAVAFVCFPGGLGTFDELFEALTLKQTGKIHHFPILLMGDKAYWYEMLGFLSRHMLASQRISPEDLDLVRYVETPQEAHAIIAASYQQTQIQRSGPEPGSDYLRS